MEELPDINQNHLEHFKFTHHVAVSGQLATAAVILLDRYSVDPRDYGEPFAQFVRGCEYAQKQGRGSFDADWALSEFDRDQQTKSGGGVPHHYVRLVHRDDGAIELRSCDPTQVRKD